VSCSVSPTIATRSGFFVTVVEPKLCSTVCGNVVPSAACAVLPDAAGPPSASSSDSPPQPPSSSNETSRNRTIRMRIGTHKLLRDR
jgi:hypothetical protein